MMRPSATRHSHRPGGGPPGRCCRGCSVTTWRPHFRTTIRSRTGTTISLTISTTCAPRPIGRELERAERPNQGLGRHREGDVGMAQPSRQWDRQPADRRRLGKPGRWHAPLPTKVPAWPISPSRRRPRQPWRRWRLIRPSARCGFAASTPDDRWTKRVSPRSRALSNGGSAELYRRYFEELEFVIWLQVDRVEQNVSRAHEA